MALIASIEKIFGSRDEYNAGECIRVDDFKLLGHSPSSTTFLTVEGTCTHFALERVLPLLKGKSGVIFYPTFEEALEAYKTSRSGVVLPLAYQMHERLFREGFGNQFREVIQGGPGIQTSWEKYQSHGMTIGHDVRARPVIQNPPMHFATRPGMSSIKTVACLPELIPWLETVQSAQGSRTIPAKHNIDAAAMVEMGQADACITNTNGLKKHRLLSLQKTGFKVMDFVWSGKIHEGYGDLEALKQDFGGLRFFPFPLSNMHYSAFLAHGSNKRENWTEAGWAWKNQQQRQHPTYWHSQEGVQALQPVTGISFWEAEACAKHFGMRLPTQQEFHFLAKNLTSSLPIHTPGFSKESSSRLPINEAHPLMGNVAKWGVDDLGRPVLLGGSSWDYGASPDTHTFFNPGTYDNNTGIFLVSGTLNRASIRPSQRTNSTKKRTQNFSRPTTPFRQEKNESSENSRKMNGRFTIQIGEREEVFDLTSLQNFPQYRQIGTFQCVCNWAEVCEVQGVLLSDVLNKCNWSGNPAETYLFFESYPGNNSETYTTCERLDRLLSPDGPTLLITHLRTSKDDNLTPLSDELGGPIRVWSTGVNGYKQVKALASIHIGNAFKPGNWEQKANYPADGTPQAGTRTLIGKIAEGISSAGGIIGKTSTYRV